MKNKLFKFLSLAFVTSLVTACGGNSSKENNSEGNVSTVSSENYGASDEVISSSQAGSSETISNWVSNEPTSSSAGSSSNSSSSGGNTGSWSTTIQGLMLTYAGEVLPYVDTGYDFDYEETTNGSGHTSLELYDYAPTYTIQNYYVQLEAAGWTMMTDDNGSMELEDDDGILYYYAYKGNAEKTNYYVVYYYFYEGYGNCIDCHHYYMETELEDEESWSEGLAELMVDALTVEIPFMKFGKDYAYCYSPTKFGISDEYYDDLTDDYAAILVENGYTYYDEDQYGRPWYYKYVDEHCYLDVCLEFEEYYGNTVEFKFVGYGGEGLSWPESKVNEIARAAGVTIPKFTSDYYKFFTKGNDYYIQTVTTVKNKDFDFEAEYIQNLKECGYVVYDDGYAVNWDETIEIIFGKIYEIDYFGNEFEYAFQVILRPIEPYSTKYAEFPATFITNIVNEKYGETISLDGLIPVNYSSVEKPFKYYGIAYNQSMVNLVYWEEYAEWVEYGIYTEEEAWELADQAAKAKSGSYIDVYDPDGLSYIDFCLKLLDNYNYFTIGDADMGYYAETASGKVGISVTPGINRFIIQFGYGSETAHPRGIALNKTNIKLATAGTFQLELTRTLLPKDAAVTWTSEDETIATVSETGLVTASATLTEGSTKITAEVTVDGVKYTAECGVKISNADESVTITAADFPTSYDESAKKRTLQGLEITMSYVAHYNNSQKIQFKKNTGVMYNETAFEPITSIVITESNMSNGFKLLAGTSANDLTEVSPKVDGATITYELEGATFFKIQNGSGASYCKSIIFNF